MSIEEEDYEYDEPENYDGSSEYKMWCERNNEANEEAELPYAETYKEMMSLYNKASYETKTEKVKALKNITYVEKSKETRRKLEAYIEANKDKIKAYRSAYYEKNKEALRASSLKYYRKGQTLRNEKIRKEIMEEITEEIKEQLREKLLVEVKEQLRKELREALREEVREALREEVREELREEFRAELREEVRKELREEINKEVKAELKSDKKDKEKELTKPQVKEACEEYKMNTLSKAEADLAHEAELERLLTLKKSYERMAKKGKTVERYLDHTKQCIKEVKAKIKLNKKTPEEEAIEAEYEKAFGRSINIKEMHPAEREELEYALQELKQTQEEEFNSQCIKKKV